MVAGLAFLSKKSFHTSNLNNQEKVWIAEQKKKNEEAKTRELARQIQLEREQEELYKITGGDGSRLDRGINWMYEEGGGAALKEEQSQKKNEEYLLGKEFVPERTIAQEQDKDLQIGLNAAVSGVSSVAATATAIASSSYTASTNHHDNLQYYGPNDENRSQPQQQQQEETGHTVVEQAEKAAFDRNEDFKLRHEDPMYIVLQCHRQKINEEEKKKALFEETGYKVKKKSSSKSYEESKYKFERKRHKQDEKERKRSRSERHYRREDERRHRKPRKSSRRHRERHRDYSSDSNEREVLREKKRSQHDRREYKNYADEGSLNRSSPSSDRKKASIEQNVELRKYGLRGSDKTKLPSFIGQDDSELGPDRSLLNKKRREREEYVKSIQESRNRKFLTNDEKREARRRMQTNALDRDRAFEVMLSSQQEVFDAESSDPKRGNGSFVSEIAHQAYNKTSEDGKTFSEREVRSKHFNRRPCNDAF